MFSMGVFRLDFFSNRHTVFRNGRGAEFLIENYVTAFGAGGLPLTASANLSTPFLILSRAEVSKVISLAMF